MRERIIKCMEKIGLKVDPNTSDFDVNDYINDSITFIVFVVELESEFGIEIPDEYLLPARLNMISNISSLFEKLLAEVE